MLARVILDFGCARLRATTVAIPDPGPLEQYLPDTGTNCAFLRRGEGFVALGQAARFARRLTLADPSGRVRQALAGRGKEEGLRRPGG